jgi:HEAT repeat protein
LLKAAKTNRGADDERVRDAAIQAIAVRAYNLSKLTAPVELSNPDLEPTLLALAGDTDPVIRFQTAYALGHIGTPAAIKQLEKMVDDPDAGTRYNAAVALAHRGNPKSIDTLAEMLDMNELAGIRDEKDEGKQFKRTVLIVTAIDAAHALARRNPNVNLAPITSALEQITTANKETLRKAYISPRVVADAKVALDLIKSGK